MILWTFKTRTEKEPYFNYLGLRSWRWVLKITKCTLELNEEVYFHKYNNDKWGLAVKYYVIYLGKWKFGRDHWYYDGPHCSIHLGWIHFSYSPDNCNKCEPIL